AKMTVGAALAAGINTTAATNRQATAQYFETFIVLVSSKFSSELRTRTWTSGTAPCGLATPTLIGVAWLGEQWSVNSKRARPAPVIRAFHCKQPLVGLAIQG